MKLFAISMLLFGMSITIPSVAQDSLEVVSDVQLMADGEGGVETYALIESVFGAGCIEAPDLYSVNHPGVKHIVETSDDWVGNHFVFKIHKNDDWDRDTGKTDRQRNEIKTYANSANNLKGYKGETMRFHWYFKLQEGFTISKNFSHFFQLKAVDGDDSQPIVTISGSINNNNPEFEIIYNKGDGASDQQLTRTGWDVANTGEWMEMEVVARFDDSGYLKIIVSDLWGNVLMSTEKNNIDLWRTGSTFVRPKWGIYRSLKSKSYLSDEEETAGFANFSLQKLGIETPNEVHNFVTQLSGIRIWPNPVGENIYVAFDDCYDGNVKIINCNGRVMSNLSVEKQKGFCVPMNQLPSGIYYITIENTGELLRLMKR